MDSWLDIVGNLWIGIVLIVVAAVPSILSARSHKGIKSIQHQVVNGHKDPLRADLDKAYRAIEEVAFKLDNVSHGLNNLRDELLHEESRRRASVQELRDDFDRKMNSFIDRFIDDN